MILTFLRCLLAEEADYCKDISRLSKKLDEFHNKKELLETAKSCFENLKENKEYIILLAKLYLLNENYHYAKKILVEYYQRNSDCEIVGYIAYTDFMLGDTESLRESLSLCEDKSGFSEELKSRFLVIKSLAEGSSGPDLKSVYPEDLGLVLTLYNKPSSALGYTLRAKSGFGYTTNALSGSPVDTATKSEQASSLFDYDFGLGINKGLTQKFLLDIESGIKGTKFFNSSQNFSPDNLSNYTIILGPGIEYKSENIQGIIKYKFDTIFLNLDTEYQKAPIQYFEGHRIELYLNLYSNYTLLLGGGRRYFDEIVRGRREFDGGFGYFKNFAQNLNALFLLTTRYYNANSDGYDDLGHSALIKLEYKTPFQLRISQFLSLGFDNYINSAGYFMNGKKREDKLLRYNIEPTYYISKYLEFYLAYTFSYRDSLIGIFDYKDHRFLTGLSLNLKSEKSIPDVSYRYEFEKSYYPIKSNESNLQNVMDILKENDSIQRGSQCKD